MRKKWKIVALLAAVILAVLVVPVVVRQVRPLERRQLEGVELSEVSYREVRFRNEAEGLDLAGMLLVPEGEGPFPAAVIIHGSGTSRRDNPWYLTLGQHLQQRGIVVLLPDKRGSEQSQGDWRTSSFEQLAGDALAAVDFLKQQDEVALSQIGIVGMSQGGHIAPLAAERAKEDVAFVVNVVGGAVPMRQALLYEEDHNLRQMGVVPGVSKAVAYLSTTYLVHVGQSEFWEAIGNYDPLPHWRRLDVPALVLYGEQDTNVDTAINAARLRALEKPNVEVAVFAGSGHALQDPPEAGKRILRADALNRISDFIQASDSAEAQTAEGS
ncbi:MAG: alpha/beta fold hydrolase [Planctomycetota bacterium]|nr:MAG: alpha/beta fold hydrolase [Planctomycetota bacterium]